MGRHRLLTFQDNSAPPALCICGPARAGFSDEGFPFPSMGSAGLVESLESEWGEVPTIGASTSIVTTFLERPC